VVSSVGRGEQAGAGEGVGEVGAGGGYGAVGADPGGGAGPPLSDEDGGDAEGAAVVEDCLQPPLGVWFGGGDEDQGAQPLLPFGVGQAGAGQ